VVSFEERWRPDVAFRYRDAVALTQGAGLPVPELIPQGDRCSGTRTLDAYDLCDLSTYGWSSIEPAGSQSVTQAQSESRSRAAR
jgi:hypothetical protein